MTKRRAAFWTALAATVFSAGLHADPLFDPVQRPLEILPETKVAQILLNLPPIDDAVLRDVLDSSDTMFYDRTTIIPGYQDSYGDNREFPVGFRPNTINPGLIAVPTGHKDLFVRIGEFNFPFGRTGGIDDASNTFVVDFWRLPRSGGKLLPVVYWKREPSNFTRRWEWMFPAGTVFGEMIFITDSSGRSHVFEIRTRTRGISSWTVDAFRPFTSASELATALNRKRRERNTWAIDASIEALIRYCQDNSNLRPASLKTSHYTGANGISTAFPTVNGAVDILPSVSDESLFIELLHETPFHSAKGAVWKQSGNLTAFAAGTLASFHVVPRNYNAALFEVSDTFCTRCHQDAGRPFRDYYPDVMLYGELWGEDETFSWHPFDTKSFVDNNGAVVNFSSDNRRLRRDFVDAGLIVPYSQSQHTGAFYRKIDRSWKGYVYR
jgi:hypothetical protein